jgi:LysM repeat protein
LKSITILKFKIITHLISSGGTGAEVVYALRNTDTLAKSILNEIALEGQIIRKYYQRRLPSDPSKDYYFMLRETGQTQPDLIEYGFIDTPEDLTRLQNHLLDYGEAVVRAVTRYLGRTYTPPAGAEVSYYTVQAGDSLYSIARKYGVTVTALRETNKLTTDLLSVGQILAIPSGVSAPPTPTGTKYTVQAGDSLYSIAGKYGVTVTALREANNLTTDLLSIGQTLIIPTTAPTPTPTPTGTKYTVQSGDNLYSIARKFGVTVDEIKSANNLTTNLLSIGQVLTIPTTVTAPAETIYTVQSGDSLYSIARKYGVTVDEIKSANNLTTNLLSIGQTLVIPLTREERQNTSGTSAGVEPIQVPATQPLVTYVVRKGDTVWSIARAYNISPEILMNANNLTPNQIIIPGQQLVIPVLPPKDIKVGEPVIYTVQVGDTVWSIARAFDVPIESLKEINNIKNDLVIVGQQLIIPTKLSSPPIKESVTYVVQQGDTLTSIAKQFGVSVNQIKDLNDLTSDLIFPEQKLIVLLPIVTGSIEKEPQKYIVQVGDSLFSVAKKYGVPLDQLKQLNDLTSNLIIIGQTLLIPEKTSTT